MKDEIDLEKLFTVELNELMPSLLANDRVNCTELYKLSLGGYPDEGAFLVRLPKREGEKREEAIIYLLQRLLLHCKLLSHSPPYPDGRNYLNLLRQQQVLANPIGRIVDKEQVGAFYEALEKNARTSTSGDYLLNGQEIGDVIILKKEEILSAIAFTEEWNTKDYLLETADWWWWFAFAV